MKIFFAFCISFVIITASTSAQMKTPDFLKYRKSAWVDSVINTLSPDERIGQLIMVAAYSNRGDEHRQEIMKVIRDHKVGGVIFFQGGPGREARLINEFQSASKVPLIMAMDAEWGLGMRLDSTISYPFQMTLGAIQDNNLIYQMGVEIARQLIRAGIHINFAPVADVNNNPDNPVINFRSFGEDKIKVSEKSTAYMKGLQDQNILATVKHFPGHGDTSTDSHFALPQINHSRQHLDSTELHPFRELIKAGVGGIMVAHLNIPSLDSSGTASTLSRPIITDLLKNEFGFQGLVVTDAMNMRGVTFGNPPGIVDRKAILAGNDLLEFTEDVDRAIKEIRSAIRGGLISQQEIDDRCRKVLALKEWAGLRHFQPTAVRNIAEELNSPSAKLLSRKLTEASLTVIRNERYLIPVRSLDTLRIASVSIGLKGVSAFQTTLGFYTQIKNFTLPKDADKLQIDSVKVRLQDYNLIIAGVHDDGIRPLNRIDFSGEMQMFISELAKMKNTIMTVFKNPYVLNDLKDIELAACLIATYEDNVNAEELAAQLIFGGISASGRLPVTIGNKFAAGEGIAIQGGIRFGYTIPEEVGMDSHILFGRIDSIVHQALDVKAIPGCQVLVAKDRKVVMNKAYGVHDYSDTVKVSNTDLYDLASLTKISTSLAALMKLYDEGKFRLDATLANYLPKFRRSNKAEITMRDILTHQGRLMPFIPFWQNTLRRNGSYKWATVKKDSSQRFPIRLTDQMFLHRKYPEKMVKGIRKSPLRPEKKYVYSDFFFMLAPRVVQNIIHEEFSGYLQKNFYGPLGAPTITYNPLNRYPAKVVVPTEHDYFFRRGPVHGTVHDENAAMMRGVSGHAGLFANANDLAKLMQMYLDGGTYGGKRFIKETTLKEFSRTQFPENGNRRALGFDKPSLQYQGVNDVTAEGAGPNTFGHTGFTGTFAWMDPDTGLLYIFLSNRVNPTRANTRWPKLNTRTQIQQVLYDAMK